MKRYLPFVIIACVLIVVIVGSVASIRSRRGDTNAPFAAPPNPAPVASTVATPVAQTSPSTAPIVSLPPADLANVSVTVEEFGDYQCPPCGLLHPELKKIVADYGSRVIFVFRNFPLTNNHKNALAAAQAAEAARLQGQFDEMHDRLYEHQADWKDQEDPRPTFTKYARELGLDLKRFARDFDGEEVRQKIDFDKQTATAREVVGTPTIFVEGRQLKPEVTTGDGIRKGIDIMLAQKAAKR